MENKNTFTKVLAVVGTVLVWIPLLAPVLFSLIRLIQSGNFMFDYLMPAELGLLAFAGSGLLLWAAFRARSRRGLIGWSLIAALVFIIGGQALAVVTGLASGATEPTPLLVGIVTAAIVAYALALVMIGVGGVLLIRDLFKSTH